MPSKQHIDNGLTHNIASYIKLKLKELNWEDKILAQRAGISPSDLSKLKNGITKKLFAKVFYALYSACNDSIENAIAIVYPNRVFSLNKWRVKPRSEFGEYMALHEQIINSIEVIAAKTDIPLQRLKDLYFKDNFSVHADELILIEMALGKKRGDAFKELFDNTLKDRK